MNYNVIIGKQFAYGQEKTGGTPLALHDDFGTVAENLGIGSVAVFEYPFNGTIGGFIDGAASVSASAKEIVIIGKYPSDEPAGYSIVKSNPINVENGILATSGYAVAVAKRYSIGKTPAFAAGTLNLPGAIEEGQIYELVVTENPILGMREPATFRITEVVNAVDTELTVMTRLVAHFNNAIKFATATLNVSGGTPLGISFVSNTAGKEFKVNGIQSLGYATTNLDVANFIGSGTYELTKKIEFDGLAEVGMNNTHSASERNVWTEVSMVEPASHYATHIIRWADPREGEISSKSTYTQKLKVCVPMDGTNPETVLKSILDAYFA